MEKTPYVKEADNSLHMSHGTSAFEKEFIDLAVHDLDAPMRKLSVLIEMLSNKITDDRDVQSYMARIENCVTDMRLLIDDLAVFGKICQDELRFNTCDIDEMIQQAVQDMPAAIKEKQAVITTQSLPVIEGDSDEFRRLFRIILTNAILYSKKNRLPEIRIDSTALTAGEKEQLQLAEDRTYYKIVISDNGIGFRNEYAEKIFRPFVRLHGKSQFSGNGIGLAICKKIMDVHKGIIYAEGEENEGAKFVLILPESH